MKRAHIIILLFLCPAIAFADESLYPTFDGPRQQNAFDQFQLCHRGGMRTLEEAFCNYNAVGDTGLANGIRNNWKGFVAAVDWQELESFFGKEFFDAFMQFHALATDAVCNFMNKDFQAAKTSLEKAKATAERLKRLPMKRPEAVSPLFTDKMILEVLICLGANECMRKNVKAGTKALQAARDRAAMAHWQWGEAQAVFCIAHYAEWAKLPTAKALYREALEVARNYRNHHFIWKVCMHLAKLHFQEGDPDSAISLLEEAITSIEFLRIKMESDADRRWFLWNKREVYQLLLKALIDTGDIRKALEISENSKARVLQDLLDSSSKVGLWGGGDDGLRTKELVLDEKIKDLEDMHGSESQVPPLPALRNAYEDVIAAIRKDNPDFGLLKVGSSADLEEIQALLDENTVLLEYNLSNQEFVYAWVVGKDFIKFKKIPFLLSELIQKVQAIRMMMGKPKSPAVHKPLGKLYEDIIKPFEKELEGKNLLIVPDGVLHYLPFAALMDTQGKFLIQRHAITTLPVMTVLQYCRSRAKRQPHTILAFGNPDLLEAKMDLPNAELEVQSIAEHFAIFPKPAPGLLLRGDAKTGLPEAQREVQQIAAGNFQTKVMLRKEATETFAKENMGKFDILHFACHGEMDSAIGSQSCLRLSPDTNNDGKLTAGDIFELQIDAQLVILSGCETGLGALDVGDEMVGLTRSFLYAGTPCVIASLWKVDDNATSILMQHLYGNLGTMGKAEALRAAQLATMKEKRHPYYWASFYLVGDGR